MTIVRASVVFQTAENAARSIPMAAAAHLISNRGKYPTDVRGGCSSPSCHHRPLLRRRLLQPGRRYGRQRLVVCTLNRLLRWRRRPANRRTAPGDESVVVETGGGAKVRNIKALSERGSRTVGNFHCIQWGIWPTPREILTIFMGNGRSGIVTVH